MKKILLFTLLLPALLSAQTVKVDNDTMYKDNVAYGLLVKTGKGSASVYSIRTLTNTEIAVAKFDRETQKPDGTGGSYRFTFLGSGAFGHLTPGFNVPKSLASAVIENNLIVDNALNPEGEKRFLAVYPAQQLQSGQPTVIVNVTNNNSPDYTTVERNRSMMIIEANGQLRQGGVDIGTCTTTNSCSGGKTTALIKYFLPNGTVCAEATCDNIGAKTATVTTFKDNRTHTVTIGNSAMKEKEIAEWLSKNFYL
jgi:hypothetical protein